ncbi:MAG TPA: AAA family ATPase, partial [Oscillospiraceae bacterium]|nr:AAA family ATPase [Oscillospiraceae bacterium]
MKLINLTLTNFKGVKEFVLDANGGSVSVFGDNATGKTTLADAQCWLLFDKDSKGTKNFSPKTKDENGQDLHNIENIVEGTYLIDGAKVTFKKVFSEVWKKKRGTVTPEFSGHTTDYFIDGVPVKANEYADRVNSLPQQTLLALSSPTYFAEELPISQRREMLMEIVGDITDDEVIASNKDLSGLKGLLDAHSVEDFLKISKARLTEINKELNSMPTRIDEATMAIPEAVNVEELDAEIKVLTDKKQELSSKILASQGEQLATMRTEIATLKANLLEGENAHKQKYADINSDINEQIKAVVSKRIVSDTVISNLKADINKQERELNNLNNDRNTLLAEYTKISKQAWAGDTVCPTCSQALPEGDVAKAQEQFNVNKSNKLLELNKKGKENCSKDL